MTAVELLKVALDELADADRCFEEDERRYGFQHLSKARRMLWALHSSLREVPAVEWTGPTPDDA